MSIIGAHAQLPALKERTLVRSWQATLEIYERQIATGLIVFEKVDEDRATRCHPTALDLPSARVAYGSRRSQAQEQKEARRCTPVPATEQGYLLLTPLEKASLHKKY